MLEAAFWGFVTAGSLWVGAALASYARLGPRAVGLAMAFGAGALIAAVAYELVIDAFDTDLRLASLGFACGGLSGALEDPEPKDRLLRSLRGEVGAERHEGGGEHPRVRDYRLAGWRQREAAPASRPVDQPSPTICSRTAICSLTADWLYPSF